MRLSLLFLLLFINPLFAANKLELIRGVDLVTGINKEFTIKTIKENLVLVFLSSKCPCSNSHVEHLNKLSKKYKSFKFIGIHSNQDESIKFSRKYFSKSDFIFPVIHDDNAIIANTLGALKTPHVFVLNSKGETLFEGGISSSRRLKKARKLYLKMALSEISQGKRPQKSYARTLGCYISRNP